MTVEVARNRRLPVAGIVVNETEPPEGIAAQTNVEELKRRIDTALLAVVPFGSDATAALEAVDWMRMLAVSG